MRISGFKRRFLQPYLFDEILKGPGHVRNVIGAVADKLTCDLVGGESHKTDCRAEYCPDVSRLVNGAREYFESKAVGLNNQVFIYGGRLEKDRTFAADNNLAYVIWNHCLATRGIKTVGALRIAVLRHVRCVYVVPFARLETICRGLTLEPLNSKYGGSDTRPEYGSGFRFRLGLLDGFLFQRFEEGVCPEILKTWRHTGNGCASGHLI